LTIPYDQLEVKYKENGKWTQAVLSNPESSVFYAIGAAMAERIYAVYHVFNTPRI
jgi:hypothetical protein